MINSQVALGPRQWLRQLPVLLRDERRFAELIEALEARQAVILDGAWGSACALAVAALAQSRPVPLVVICPKAADADALNDDLELFLDRRALRFPAWESEPGHRLVYDEIYGDRLRALKTLRSGVAAPLFVSSIQGLLQPVPPPAAVEANTRRLARGASLDEEEFVRWMVGHGFHATSGVELPGEFSRRGGIIDVFAADWDAPVRLELYGDQIESLRQFDVASQRSLESLDSIEVTILPSAGDDPMRAAGEKRAHLADYLPASSWFAVVEPEATYREGERYLERLQHPAEAHGLEATMRHVARFGHALISALATSGGAPTFAMRTETVERFSGDVRRVRDELEEAAHEQDVFVICQTQAEIKRLQEVFDGSPLWQRQRLHLVEGYLREGFHHVAANALLLSGAQLFQRSDLRRTPRRRLGRKIDSFLDLREGDLVVHLSHGIGRYRGLKRLQRENQVEDHLAIEFAGGTKIFVPTTKIDLVQKYVGGSRARPRLAKIGGKQWVLRKRAAEAAVVDMAADLLELQAQRAARPGIAFGSDTEWQREFDASFPYEETLDQLAAATAIKSDMELARPMDRLLCGDVGFGKTEVAMRAVFKAVDNGYQVAVLVPTTILAEQHFHTFQERIAEFPFEIAKLSRFCSAGEQRETVKRLASGQIDVVIGTHRLASRDVSFANLGLVIIDEEQRFGVEVKERLKSLRTTVDILTMTATPIPRTLHMSMTGIRDISNLETPPDERIAVETRVTRWDDQLIRNAVLRELNRGGQVYFVHNRVHDIGAVKFRLQHIVPEARIEIGHGQMAESHLERVMVDFVAGRFDVLLATTIVESGLDIPNANTIFIDDADRYGLADLHQLRGRVGRYKHRAYCYLLVQPHKHITPEAARRLRAIEEFSQMGAGFAIAMRDLEFRGAGNILGTEQSGHIAAVGYELYCQLLEAAVRRMRKLPPKLTLDVNVDLPGEAYIPDDYVPDLRMKIDLYRRIARIASTADLKEIEAELVDRFGRLPSPARQLLALADLRVDAALWQIEMIRLERQDGHNYLAFDYTDPGRIRQLAKRSERRLRVVDERTAYARCNGNVRDPAAVLADAKSVLRDS